MTGVCKPWFLIAAAMAAAATVPAAPAAAQQLITDLSQHQIAIRSNFTGTEILLFGTVESGVLEEVGATRDIVVVVAGPERPVTVRRKERVGGIWLNYVSVSFELVPGYYAVASTRPLDMITNPEIRTVEKIGADNLSFGAYQAADVAGRDVSITQETKSVFAEALVRNKTNQGLYLEDPGGVTFLGSSLFRVTLDIPANVPVGLYTAKVFLLRNGTIVDAISSPLYIEKSGIERAIFRFAQIEPLLYGLFAVALAIFAGWLGSAVLRER